MFSYVPFVTDFCIVVVMHVSDTDGVYRTGLAKRRSDRVYLYFRDEWSFGMGTLWALG